MLTPALNPLALTAATLSLGVHAVAVGVLLLEPAAAPTDRVRIVPVVQAARAPSSTEVPTAEVSEMPAAEPADAPASETDLSAPPPQIRVNTVRVAPTATAAPRPRPTAAPRSRSAATTETASLGPPPAESRATRAVPRVETRIAVLPGNAQPRYPLSARKRGYEGQAIIRVEVSGTGQVAAAEIVESSGFDILDHAAREAVARWQFQPATRDGRPTAGRIDVPIEFRLR